MTQDTTHKTWALALAGGFLLVGSGPGAVVAQDQGSALTRSLNGAPARSVPTPTPSQDRPNARPPVATGQKPPGRPSPTLEDLLADTQVAEPADEPDERADAPAQGVTLAPGETEPEPIPVSLGYYARGDTACDQVWPREGNLAWMTPTSFTIDFGGCEPGQFLQTGPNAWREDQRCETESGGDAGAYNITYEVMDAGTLKRTARLAIDGSVEQDLWTFCRTEDVPENARFEG